MDENAQPVIKHNDKWFEEFQAAYIDLCEKSDDTLEKQAYEKVTVTEDDKVDQQLQLKVEHEKKVGTLLSSQIEAEVDSIKSAVTKLESEVNAVSTGALQHTKAESFKTKVRNLEERLNVY